MGKLSRGFTLVELMIVTAVIGILATITIVGFSNIQASSRDTQRADKIATIAEALEKYYSANGEYPDCYAMSKQPASAVTGSTSTLPGLDPTDLQAPTAASGTNSIVCGALAPGSSLDAFGYVGDGSTTCSNSSSTPVGSCLQYTLQYRQESTGNIVSLNSRHSTLIATSGSVTLSSAAASSFSQVGLAWNNISNATYNVEYSTDPTFVTSPVTVSTSSSPYTVTGLRYGTLYYFRVMPVSPSSSGSWSSSLSATTWSLATPVPTNSSSSATSLTFTWPSISHADNYAIQLSTNSSPSPANDIYNSGYGGSLSSPSYTASSLTAGVIYYFEVQATAAPSYSGSYSSAVAASTVIPAPAAFSITSSSTYNALTASAPVVCGSGLTPTYQWYANGTLWVSGPSYQTVTYTISNGQTITLTASGACYNSQATSSYTSSSNSASLTWAAPWAEIGTGVAPGGYRAIGWDGTCPAGSTSANFAWSTGGTINKSGNTGGASGFSDTGVAWGNGGANVTLTCYGPWGGVTAHGYGPYGAACVPTITNAATCDD
jgi:prepilin-type N-terminal cleavage/methylation domain-containing protein